EAPLALAAVEARDVPARERDPRHTAAVDVESAHAVAGRWNSIDFGQGRLGRIRAGLQPQNETGMTDVRSPDRAVDRVVGDAVEAETDARVLGGIAGLIRLDPRVALAVAVGVDDERRPALRFPGVVRLPEHLRVDPADDRELVLQIVAEPQRVVRV